MFIVETEVQDSSSVMDEAPNWSIIGRNIPNDAGKIGRTCYQDLLIELKTDDGSKMLITWLANSGLTGGWPHRGVDESSRWDPSTKIVRMSSWGESKIVRIRRGPN